MKNILPSVLIFIFKFTTIISCHAHLLPMSDAGGNVIAASDSPPLKKKVNSPQKNVKQDEDYVEVNKVNQEVENNDDSDEEEVGSHLRPSLPGDEVELSGGPNVQDENPYRPQLPSDEV